MTEGASAERVLFVRLSAMGDVLQCLPALAALRAARPDAQLGWVVERRFAGLVEGHAALDRVFVWERRKGGSAFANAGALARLRADLRAWRPHVALDLQGNLRGALVARLSGAPRRIALPRGEAREGAQRFATETAAPAADPREHRSARALRLVAAYLGDASAADVSADPAADVLPPVADAARAAVRAALDGAGLRGRTFAVFVAGTSDFGAFKRWPAERFGALARRLTEDTGWAVLVSHGPGQEPLAAEIAACSGGAARPAPPTRSLAELRALLDEAALVVGADSGPVVLAGLAGRPTVALFGPKDPEVYAPRGAATAVVWKGVYCSPCALRRCDDPICMTRLDEDAAWDGMRRAVALARRGGDAA